MVGTHAGGLTRHQEGRFTHLSTGEGLPDARVRCLYEDRLGALWMGTDAGVATFREGNMWGIGAVVGTFSWQLQPYGNRVTVNVVPTGAVNPIDGGTNKAGRRRARAANTGGEPARSHSPCFLAVVYWPRAPAGAAETLHEPTARARVLPRPARRGGP